MKPYQILEVANTHGGDLNYLISLIEEFSEFKDCGIKFQPLHPDKIATKDFASYSVYQELLFLPNQWEHIIKKAGETKDVWLDIFDTYGTEIFEGSMNSIKGIKLQPSILYNQEVLNELKKLLLNNHLLIINISALNLDDINERIQELTRTLKPKEIWIEVGFQSYPTELLDCGYVKIDEIKKHFSNKIVFADHADGKGGDTVWLPIFAALKGVDVIEKHIMHSSYETKYDYFSSINKNKYSIYLENLKSYLALNNQPFINEREYQYLANSVQIPIASKKLSSGSLINYSSDLEYKRSGLIGIDMRQLIELQKTMHILANDIDQGKTLQKTDFKKATISTIIACRLKSSRLPRKALLNIGNITSVEKCIQSCLRFKNINHTILATSILEEDAELIDYTYNPNVVFHKGDPDDVIRRYLDIIDQLKIDVIVRVTADMPFVSSQIVEILLQSHFDSGADYTVPKEAAVGTGVEIINASALRKIKSYFPNALYSEYMTWYFQNNPEHFKLNFVVLPDTLVRNYRLTLDYQEDIDLFNAIQVHLDENKLEPSMEIIFSYLDSNPTIASINSHLTLKYQTDQKLINILNKETKIL